MMEWMYIPSPCYLVVPGSSLVPRSPPTIEELLWTIRDAWPPPRSLSLDSEKRDKPRVPGEVMGTGSQKDGPSPRMGLPFRRYSVPEIVMRKYSLSRAQTSASEAVTAPTPSVPSLATSSGTVRRMCHKACQTSPPGSANKPTVPTVNIIPTTCSKEELSKHSSNSYLSPSEDVLDYGVCVNQVYESELSLPGAVLDSARLLQVPELVLDPHDSPHVNSDDEKMDDIINPELINTSGTTERNKYTETDDTLDNENLSSLQEQSNTQGDNQFYTSVSNSVPEFSEPITRTNQRMDSVDVKDHHEQIDSGEFTIEKQFNFEESLSQEGTPTPAPTCHTYDSQGNMLSECYITDCEVCNAEGRKCCSLDDSGSQSCSYTSPEMISSNELKSSTDFTTSSMTLDQTVSDRTTSTQDSTISLTSITPESAESKEKCSTINISPVLVIDSETTIVDVSPRSKNKCESELNLKLESSESEVSKSQSFLDKIPSVISCESGIVPLSDRPVNANITKLEPREEKKMSLTQSISSQRCYSEMNNNKVTTSKDIHTQVSEPLSTIKENEVIQITQGSSKAAHYLYLSESESGNTQDSDDKYNKTKTGHKIVGNYCTSHLYLTETESSPTEEAQKNNCDDQLKKGDYSSNYMYMTESESTGGITSLTTENDSEVSIDEKKAGNYASNYMYITDSETSGCTRTTNAENKEYGNRISGSYSKNYLYMTESESPDTRMTQSSQSTEEEKNEVMGGNYKTGANATDYLYMTESESPDTRMTQSSQSTEEEKNEVMGGNYKTGANATDYLYMTESESSEGTKQLKPNNKKEKESIRKNVGSYAKNYMYITESDSPETNKTLSPEAEVKTDKENKDNGNVKECVEELRISESTVTSSVGAQNLKLDHKNVRKSTTDYLYLTETESSDNMTNKIETTDDRENETERKNVGNYSSNYMYITESESPKSNGTISSEGTKGVEFVDSRNYATKDLHITGSEISQKTETSKADIVEDQGSAIKSGNFATTYLYMTESESSEKNETDQNKKGKSGNSTKNYLYLTESESATTTKSSITENEDKNPKKKLCGQYATSHLYITESDSTLATKSFSLESDIDKTAQSDASSITNVLSESKVMSNKTTGNYSKGYLYLSESDSAKTQSATGGEDFRKSETQLNYKKGRNYTTNYLYMTEDESSFNPDSLENDMRSSKEEFEMDSLAINESTDESNLLENLGFCETLSTAKCQSITTDVELNRNELTDLVAQKKFYGNIKYEIILRDTEPNKGNFKGNVMPVQEMLGFQQSNVLTDKVCTSPIVTSKQYVDLVNKGDVDNVLGCKMVDQETTMGSVAGGTYWEIPGKELVIPRFSALPRTLSMIVNTSSMDCSSDSDLSLADSLEDNKSDDKNKGLKLYNKYDNRLVRGDIIGLLPEESEIPKKTSKESQAYFLSITGEEGEIKVEQIPEELKKKLLKRDMEIRKHSDHLSSQGSKCKGKNCSKKSRKHHHHCCTSTADHSSKSSSKTRSLDEFSSKISKFTQWEDLDSSKDSSDTLVPSDFSEKDKDTIFLGDYKLKDKSTSPRKCEYIDNDQQNDLNSWLETVKNTCEESNIENDEESEKRSSKSKNTPNKNQNFKSKTKEIKTQENKWVQCENMPHIDSKVDEEIARILIENSTDDRENNDSTDKRKFKCSEHNVPWSKDMFVQVSQDELLVQDIVDVDVQTNTCTESKSVQTADGTGQQNNEKREKIVNKNKISLEETNKLELNLTGSPRNQKDKWENEKQFLNVAENEERCKTPVPGERTDGKNENIIKQDKTLYSKPTPKFNVKSTPSRRSGNLGARFKQKFEVIPEEKSGSFESSNDEKNSSKYVRNRRASMPSETIYKDLGHSQNKSSDSSTSSNERKESEECEHMRNIQTAGEAGDYPRRHTIHGNLTARNTKTEATNQDKNEHSRRHTIHGSLSLSKNDMMLKQLNLLGGTLLKGRVFGKQSGVMFGRFRPINEETQVQKDERSLVEEQLERLRRDASKGREALAVARTEGEQDELLTLSKGWINFYLLRDSQDLGSDGSNADEGLKDNKSEDRSKRAPPSMKTVTVVGKSEEDLRHQFTVQINASPETCPESGKLPDILDQNVKSYKTPSLSPDLTLPDISPTSTPASTPPLPDTPHSLKPELPQIHPKGVSRNKRSVNEKYKSNAKKPPEKGEKKVHIDNDQNVRYMKLSSMKQELQTEKTYFARSGEVACSELSQSSSTSVTADSPTLPSIKWPSRQLQRRSHSRHLHTRNTPTNPPQACWTVTLAGSSGNPTQPPPDVEMRLSFSNQQRGPATSQSDSGLGEDGPPERGHRGHHALPPPSKHPPPDTSQWKVLLKTHQETEKSSDQVKTDKRASLPEFNFTPGTARQKKSNKRGGRSQEDPPRPASVQVQEILEHNISLHKSSLTEEEWVEGLSVTGQAITPERKPRVPTMSERDLTRQWYHRSRLFH